MTTVRIAQSDDEIRQCLLAMVALRTHLTPEQAFSQIRLQQVNEGFMLAFVDAGAGLGPAPAVVGYRTLTFLYSGKPMYVYDLSTLS